jgi:hypothetical protein
VSQGALVVQLDPTPRYFWDWGACARFFKGAITTPRIPRRLYPQSGRTGQNGAERGRCGLVRSGPLGRPLRPVDALVKKEAGAKGSGGGRLKERGWGAWLHCAGNAVLRAWLHCAGYWAKGTPSRGPSAGLSVSGSAWLSARAVLARPRGAAVGISETLPACLVVDRN